METDQLKYSALLLVVAWGLDGCARMRSAPTVSPVVLAQSCPVGPHCVTGQVQDRYGSPIADVRCAVRTDEGEVVEVKSDERGLFLIDKLTSPPRGATFVKDGYANEMMTVQPVATGAAARIYVTLQQADEESCTCDSAAIFSGQPPCSEDRCSGERTRQGPPASGSR
ncbi:MAG TPA: carboxypeptidase-like regulatory domain-containing protein [Polyangia bacterium]|nr:carboxypeptidase-like regulatory domain-containing protein [Polyangia bacterium]